MYFSPIWLISVNPLRTIGTCVSQLLSALLLDWHKYVTALVAVSCRLTQGAIPTRIALLEDFLWVVAVP